MESYLPLVVLAFIVEAVVESIVLAVKAIQSKQDVIKTVGPLVLGAMLCPLAGVDAFAYAGVPLSVPYLGGALTGLAAARLANGLQDAYTRLQPKHG